MKKNLQGLRKAKKLTLRQVSEQTGIPLSTISAVENGTRPLTDDIRIRLAEFYSVDPVELEQNSTMPQPTGLASGMTRDSFITYLPANSYERALSFIDEKELRTAHEKAVEQEDWEVATILSSELSSRKRGRNGGGAAYYGRVDS
jgi:transcriptional regulator with XRE-family HTH domain